MESTSEKARKATGTLEGAFDTMGKFSYKNPISG